MSLHAQILVLAAAVAVAAPPAFPASSSPAAAPVTLTTHMPVGGDGGWDYLTVDGAARRLYVTRGSHVQIVDLARDTVIGDIPNTPGVHGVALVPRLGRGYTSNGRDSSVTVFDLATFAVITTVRIPARGPDAILYDRASNRVFTFDGGSSDAVAIDPDSNQVVGRLALGGRPEAAVADGAGGIYVNLEDKSTLTWFDARTLTIKANWPVAPGEEPSGLAYDAAHHRLFSGCANKTLVVLDARSGKRVASVPIGDRVDGVGFDPKLGFVYSTNGEGTLSVIRENTPDRYTPYAPVPTQRGARTIAVDSDAHRVYTCTAQFGETPPATPEQPRPRTPIVPGSFVILALDAKSK